MSDACGSCSSGQGAGGCSGCESEDQKLKTNLSRIKHKIVVLSGKGGVGKSTVATNIAVALAQAGKQVGLLDVDVHGPSVPRLLSLQDKQPHIGQEIIEPVSWSKNLWVMSLGFMLPNKNDAVIWRGPVKMGLITQFLRDVAWGDLDFLVVDCPPGTGDEPLSALQTIGPDAYAVIVTTPQGVAIDDVRRSVTFCKQVGNPVLGIVENMSGFACPDCGKVYDIFNSGGGEQLAREMDVPFLGRIPIEPEVARSGDEGFPYVKVEHESPAAQALGRVVKPMLKLADSLQEPAADQLPTPKSLAKNNGALRVALPIAEGRLCQHFGHCQQFAVYDVDTELGSVVASTSETPPPHEPGVLPKWIAGLNVDLVLAGGMGAKAQSLLKDEGVQVIVGAPSQEPEKVLEQWMKGSLQTGANTCDH
ncbi:Chromosome partitioning ATPase, Mrp family, contains Fe-S cluster [Paucidesulfovibrio gracilis DSM 16080]|uniref:Iron-sulfur cluster carrier protein n=1 Tax=Paucidesulfovibrio gracilis DSM 16080 TaxID=1121449 RepID=A0A1T4X2T2_9BACT|nr:iron-sulfur cluster carrier protein MrpORP [Paucidesulfovibrio gracilis]SKA83468.1 Chromosome partitioning ATPase, Mrp family, contains Fe-S cluster [Paucidesulfovibrio gracilis DSM 16080]